MSFRKYGGTQYSAIHNIVKSNVNTTSKFYVTQNIGQPNTYINFESDISGNIIIYGDLDVSGNLTTAKDAYINGLTVGRGGGNSINNTALGQNALQNNTTGVNNTALGQNTLKNNTNGNNNVAVGPSSLQLNTSGSTNIAIGHEALLYNTTGASNIGINSGALYNNTTGIYNIAIGQNSLIGNTVGTNNIGLGNSAGSNLSGNSNTNTFLGNFTNVASSSRVYNNSTAIGYQSIVNASNQIVLGTATEKIYIPGSYLGINTYTPGDGYALDVSGNVNATSYNSSSDYRIKKDVVPLDEKFTVDNLKPVTYNNINLGKQDIGLIAHELQEVYPFLVNGEKDGENLQSVNYTGLIGILIKEIQELKERVKKLEEK